MAADDRADALTAYADYVAQKRRAVQAAGFGAGPITPTLFEHQQAIVRWALRLGRAAIFADTGLGKTAMQLVAELGEVVGGGGRRACEPVGRGGEGLDQHRARAAVEAFQDRGLVEHDMSARENEDERHICPLQLEVIRRCLTLWSRRDDVVLSPFAGIGSEGHVALEMGRRFVGAELKRSYYEQAVRNLHAATRQKELFGTVRETA